jgi:Tfp pilus assembly protein PilP
MKLMTSILAVAMMTGGVAAQNPNVINNVQNKVDAAQPKSAGSNAAPAKSPAAPSSKPGAGAPAPAVKPAQIPGAKPAAATKPAAAEKANTSAPKAAGPSSANKLERVNVVSHPDEVQIEISSQQAVTPKLTKLNSPERLLIELPATAVATRQNKIAVGSAGVKGVRIGMDGKTPPTTSVVVDLEKAHEYEMTPGPATKLVLTLHGQAAPSAVAKSVAAPAVAKNAPTVAKAVTPAPTNKSVPMPKAQTTAAKPLAAPAVSVPKVAVAQASAPAAPQAIAKPAATSAVAPKPVIAAASAAKTVVAAKNDMRPPVSATKISAQEKPAEKIGELPKPPKPEEKKWAMTGKRDPFFSPVVQDSSGSGCSTGKKCLEIGQINVRGVVKSDTGYIAVVTNSQDKAYFLHENDPVFNGYVLRITGDSVVFQETVQDKLGKPFLREVTKKLTTPAV